MFQETVVLPVGFEPTSPPRATGSEPAAFSGFARGAWSPREESNLRPAGSKPDTLSTELRGRDMTLREEGSNLRRRWATTTRSTD